MDGDPYAGEYGDQTAPNDIPDGSTVTYGVAMAHTID